MNANSYEALRERAAWIDLTGRGKIRATGDDRVRFLHSMTTGNIEELVPGSGCYTFFLTAQGRIIADANIFAMTDYLLIDTEPETKQRVFEHLDKFIIADDVMLHDFSADSATLNVEGPKSKEILEALNVPVAQLPCSIAEWAQCSVAHVSYTGQTGYSFFFPNEHKEETVAKLTDAGLPQAGLDIAEIVRIENGRPRYGVDITETTIPQETQQMHAVHANKGCYIGQEIVERVRSRGHVNKLLSSLEIEASEPPGRGTKIQSEGKDVGEITSAVFSPARNKVVAMGIVRGEAINGPLTVNGATATVRRAAS
jgi:tRNA-modifying protein YgfZ